MSYCRSCDAPIIWIVTKPGNRSMPIDPEPQPDGTILVDFDKGVGVVLSKGAIASIATDLAATNEPLYRSHFATCPQAQEHRRAR
jgi:hypothetical protein